MAKLCERPGCSNPGEAAYGMVAEELLFWLAPLGSPEDRGGVLCRRHADAMIVPRGWTLDDRRHGGPALFQAVRFASTPAVAPLSPPPASPPPASAPPPPPPPPVQPPPATSAAPAPVAAVPEAADATPAVDAVVAPAPPAAPRVRRSRRSASMGEQLQLDGTSEIARPALPPELADDEPAAPTPDEPDETPVAEAGWVPRFDTDDDLNGVLDVRSPLLSRAFRGTDLPR